MFTVCTNPECGQRYKIKPEFIGAAARCKKCNNVFQVAECVESRPIIDLGVDEPQGDGHAQEARADQQAGDARRRRSSKEVMDEHIAAIRQGVMALVPRLNHCQKNQFNESDTRILINQMLQDVLGFRLEDIKTEQSVEGRKADYLISVNGQPVMVIEAKRIGAALRQRQIFQATSYAAYSGISWAVLTNAWVWQLYHISTGDKVETDLIFSVDIMDGLSEEEAYYLYLISRPGLMRKGLLDDMWRRASALCSDNIVNAILSDEVIAKIRSVLTRQTGYRVADDELRQAIEESILQL